MHSRGYTILFNLWSLYNAYQRYERYRRIPCICAGIKRIKTLVRRKKNRFESKMQGPTQKTGWIKKKAGSTQKCPTQHASFDIAIITPPPPPPRPPSLLKLFSKLNKRFVLKNPYMIKSKLPLSKRRSSGSWWPGQVFTMLATTTL